MRLFKKSKKKKATKKTATKKTKVKKPRKTASRSRHFAKKTDADKAAKRRGKKVYKIPKIGWYVGTEAQALKAFNFANNVKSKRSIKADKSRSAMKPGKRISKDGNVYYEYRQNRSDKSKKI